MKLQGWDLKPGSVIWGLCLRLSGLFFPHASRHGPIASNERSQMTGAGPCALGTGRRDGIVNTGRVAAGRTQEPSAEGSIVRNNGSSRK